MSFADLHIYQEQADTEKGDADAYSFTKADHKASKNFAPPSSFLTWLRHHKNLALITC